MKETPIRLDVWLAERYPDKSRTQVAGWIRQGHVWVNGKPAKPNTRVTPKDAIIVEEPEEKETTLKPENLPLTIVWQDAYLAIIEKEAGMIVHPAPGVTSGTLVHALLYHLKDELSTEGGLRRPGIVHRLDRDTTGLLIIAKDDATHRALSRQIQERNILREYIAMVHGHLREEKGTVILPIGRSRSDTGKMAVRGRAARDAVTHFQLEEQFADCALVRCRLETGRTHQIRVHMRAIGHPILGDPLYGIKKERYKLPHQLLHAQHLAFTHPKTKEPMEFVSEPPKPFSSFLAKQRAK